MKTGLLLSVLGLSLVGGLGHTQSAGGVEGGASGQSADAGIAKSDDATVKKSLQVLYDRCVLATKKRDESVMAVLRAQNFTFKETNGKIYTRDQVETSERQVFSQVQRIDSVSSQVDSVKRDNGKVTATVRQTFHGTLTDAQNKTHTMTVAMTTHDDWLQQKEGWKLQSVQVLGRQETWDGKPFDPNAVQNTNNNAGGTRNGNPNNRNTGYYRGNGYRQPKLSLAQFPKTKAPKIKPHKTKRKVQYP